MNVPAAPFADLLLAREQEPGGLAALVTELRRSTKWIYRYKKRINDKGETVEHYNVLDVEDALVMLGLGLQDLYPELVEHDSRPPPEAWCSKCDEAVLTGSEGRCLWCDTLTRLSEADRLVYYKLTCPDCGGPKSKGAAKCFACRMGSPPPLRGPSNPANTTCPDCGGRKSHKAVRCRDCWVDHDCNRGKRSRRAPTRISEDTLIEAHRLYFEARLSLSEIAARLYPESGYASLDACKRTLCSMFATRGWKLRSRSEALRLSHARRAVPAAS